MRTQAKNRLQVARDSVIVTIEEHLIYLDKAIIEMDRAIRQKIDDDSDFKQHYRLLDSVPGLGEKTILVPLARNLKNRSTQRCMVPDLDNSIYFAK